MSIKRVRMSANMTQIQLANKMSVARSTVGMWELGLSAPRADKLPELARILECTIDELLFNEAG